MKTDKPKKLRDNLFKGIFESVFRKYKGQIEIFTELEVRRQPRYIDVAFIKKEKISPDIPLYTILSLMNKWTAIEFKSEVDRLSKTVFAKGMGYIADLLENKQVEFPGILESTFCLITVNVPEFLRNLLDDYFTKIKQGIYQFSSKTLNYVVVLINELEIIEENKPLLVFASGKKIEEVIMDIIISNDKTYLWLLRILHRDEVVKITESMGVVVDPYEESIRKGIQDIINIVGLEEIINQAGIEEVIDVVGIDKLIDAVGIDKLLEKLGIDLIFKIPKKKAMKYIEEAKKTGRITEEQAELLKKLYNIS